MGETVFIGKYLTIGLILPLGFLFYSILFSIAYFSKERMDNYENKVYKWILIDGLALLIMEFVNTIAYYALPETYAKVELRFYLMMFVGYLELLSTYMEVISRTKEDVEKDWKKIIGLHSIVFAFCTLLIWTGDITYVASKYGLGADGTATMWPTAFDAVICVILWSINIKRNARKINKVKYIPFFAYLIGSFALGAVQVKFPGFLLITPLVNFTNTILYFTVENPDMKVINQLTLAKSSAEKASRAKTEFLSSMSHEIRTPLNAVIGFSECIKSAPTLEDAQEDANEIVKASNTLLELVNGIIDFSKIEDGNLEVQEVSYKPREVFSSLAKLVTPKMNEKKLSFSLFISKNVPETLFGDKENLRKIVTNLLTNAYKYTEKGSVLFSINAENKTDKTKLVISVKDTGHGIKKENIEGIFKSFERLEEDKDGVTSGTGLGLAITKQLVNTMKGKIDVDSVYGEGSTFTVEIEQKIEQLADANVQDITTEYTQTTQQPIQEQVVVQPETVQEQTTVVETSTVVQPTVEVVPTQQVPVEPVKTATPAQTVEQPSAQATASTQTVEQPTNTIKQNTNGSYTLNLDGKTFLLIDDNVLNLKIASKLLEKMNAHNITTMTNGYELIEKIKSGQKYDLIISDDMMPEISGTETLAELKKIPGFSIPVVVLTANAMEGMREEYLQKGFDEYIAKPINREILTEILAKLLNDQSIIVPIDENAKQETPTVVQPTPSPVVQSTDAQVTAVYDENYLRSNGVDLKKSIEILGDMSMYNMAMTDFLASVEERKNRMIEFKDKNDMKNYAIDVHSLKSDSKYLGFNTLADICLEHETKSKENDAKFVCNDYARLEEELNKVITIAKNYATYNNL